MTGFECVASGAWLSEAIRWRVFGFGLGPTEAVVVGLVALLLFGHRVPSMMRSLGLGLNEFRRGLSEQSFIPEASTTTGREDGTDQSEAQPTKSQGGHVENSHTTRENQLRDGEVN